jgi:hypothetical protein
MNKFQNSGVSAAERGVSTNSVRGTTNKHYPFHAHSAHTPSCHSRNNTRSMELLGRIAQVHHSMLGLANTGAPFTSKREAMMYICEYRTITRAHSHTHTHY